MHGLGGCSEVVHVERDAAGILGPKIDIPEHLHGVPLSIRG